MSGFVGLVVFEEIVYFLSAELLVFVEIGRVEVGVAEVESVYEGAGFGGDGGESGLFCFTKGCKKLSKKIFLLFRKKHKQKKFDFMKPKIS